MHYFKINLWIFEWNSCRNKVFTMGLLTWHLWSSVIYSNCHVLLFTNETRGNLLQLFCIWTSYVSLRDYLRLTLKFHTVHRRLHDVINIVNQNVLSCQQVSNYFYHENMTPFLNYVTATLMTLYAWHDSSVYIFWGKHTINTDSNILLH